MLLSNLRVVGARSAAVVGFIAVSTSWVWSQSRPTGQAQSAAPTADSVDIVLQDGSLSRLTFGAIKKASTGPIERGGLKFDFTPLLVVMRAVGIPGSARIHVTGDAGDEMTLQHGAPPSFDTEDFGFIFNQRAYPVLTPRPGTRPAAAPLTNDRPQVRDVIRIEVVRNDRRAHIEARALD
jgi:hypothetical protein